LSQQLNINGSRKRGAFLVIVIDGRMSDIVHIVPRSRLDRLGEGLIWSAEQRAVFWVDILGQRLNKLSLYDGRIDEWAMPEMIGWIVERAGSPLFLIGLASGIKSLSLDPLQILDFVDLPDEPAGNRLNDAKVDAAGRLWAGTMQISQENRTGSLYCIEPDKAVRRVDTQYGVANGPAISPDGKWLYHSDSPRRTTYRFALHDDGQIGDRETWLKFEDEWGYPDGMTCDADGGVWIAHWGGARVSRFGPDAVLDRSITLPASQITNITFAGDAFDRMFVTSAADGVDEDHGGALFEIDPGCCGFAPYKFAG
jgi:xylono-1,5-lactonase